MEEWMRPSGWNERTNEQTTFSRLGRVMYNDILYPARARPPACLLLCSVTYPAMRLLYIPPYATTIPHISRLAAPVVGYKHHLQRAALAIP